MRATRLSAVVVLALLGCAACGGGNIGTGPLRSAVLQSDGRTIALEFDSCHDTFEVAVAEETASQVVLTIHAEGATDDLCADGGLVELADPLGDRRVTVEGANGTAEIQVLRPDGGGPPPTTNLSSLLEP